jgi:thiol-disulfide isomerase/thioredoxin
VSERVDLSRRQLVVNAARALAVAPLGLFAATASAQARLSRELKAIAGAAAWVNFPRLTDESLAGKVVLVDFCTYTCINWLRTLPHVRAWAAKYRMHGLQVVGIHTPEFGFEHDLENVRRAIARMAIDHPIALDNDYGIWRAFDNHHWPALYFIDARGRMRSHHFGEGEFTSAKANTSDRSAPSSAC